MNLYDPRAAVLGLSLLILTVTRAVGAGNDAGPGTVKRPLTSALALLDARIYREIRELFRAYEMRNLVSFRQVVGLGARTADDFRFGAVGRQLAYSVNCDFQNLRSIDFDVEVYPPQYKPDRKSGQVKLVWYRRARFNQTGQEWLVRNQTSVLYFDMRSERPRLTQIEGDPLFGLCNPVEVLIVDRGTIDGVHVAAPLTARNGRLGEGAGQLGAFGVFRRGQMAGRPDMRIRNADVAIPANIQSNTNFTVAAIVTNVGTGPTGPFMVTFAIGPLVRTANVANLSPGATTTVNSGAILADGINFPVGLNFQAFVTADAGGLVAESNEANNQGSRAAVVVP